MSKKLSCSIAEADIDSYDTANKRISRIALSGHPENKYVVSEDDAKKARYITFNDDKKQYEVQYNQFGTMGPPVIQPNKYQYFQRIAFRLGRDIRLLFEVIASDVSDSERLQEQLVAMNKTLQQMKKANPGHTTGTIEPSKGKELSLTQIARELLKTAPELKEDSGLDANRDVSTLTEAEAAQIIQLQLIEESNNNWESRFPEDENVWDWVDNTPPTPLGPPGDASDKDPNNDPRSSEKRSGGVVEPTAPIRAQARTQQYFSRRRWPVECQSPVRQNVIKASGPALEPETQKTKPQIVPYARPVSRAQMKRDAVGPWPREQYTGYGGPAHFPFGETPIQQALQSMQMEEDLKDSESSRVPPPLNESRLTVDSRGV